MCRSLEVAVLVPKQSSTHVLDPWCYPDTMGQPGSLHSSGPNLALLTSFASKPR